MAGGVAAIAVDASQNVTVPVSMTVGNSSNTRWASVPLLTGVGSSTSLTVNTTNIRWSTAASTTSDLWFSAPASVLGTKIKAVRAYYTTTGYSAGSITLKTAFYEVSGGSTAAASGTNTVAIASSTSSTLTATAGTSSTLAAGEQVAIRVWISANSSDATTYITSIEVQYEEREY